MKILIIILTSLININSFAADASSLEAIADSIPHCDSLSIYSEYTQEDRKINIWTPPNYSTSNDSLPVLYMPDGGIKEDFPHIANTLAKLIANGQIPPHILVGIENTERWRDLTGASAVKKHEKYQIPMTDGSTNFRAFITEELMPEINKKYRTSGKKGIIGESLGGLFVLETLMLKPETFDFYIAMDPSLWWNNAELVKNSEKHLANLPKKGVKLWFAGSDAKGISKHTKKLAKKLEKDSPAQLIWQYANEPDEKHNTIFRATKEKALVWALNKK